MSRNGQKLVEIGRIRAQSRAPKARNGRPGRWGRVVNPHLLVDLAPLARGTGR